MFDIAQVECVTAADEGRPMKLISPTGEILNDSDGKPVTITLHGRLSHHAKTLERRLADLRIAQAGQKRTVDDVERENVEMLTALTKDWTFDQLDGQTFPCNESNARKFWADRRFANIREQAVRFVNTDANFMKG